MSEMYLEFHLYLYMIFECGNLQAHKVDDEPQHHKELQEDQPIHTVENNEAN